MSAAGQFETFPLSVPFTLQPAEHPQLKGTSTQHAREFHTCDWSTRRRGTTKWVSDLRSRCGPTAGWICQSMALGWLCSMTASTAHQYGATSSASRCEWGAAPGTGMGSWSCQDRTAAAPVCPFPTLPTPACGRLSPLTPPWTWGATSSPTR